MVLVPAANDELEDIAALINAAYRGEVGWTTETDYLTGERINAAALRAQCAARPDGLLLALREDGHGAALGCVWMEPLGEGEWRLGLLTVRPDRQDAKVGRSLLAEAEAAASARGARRVSITVVNIREALIAWYERRGFVRTGVVEPFPYEDQRFGAPLRGDLSFVVMEKTLKWRE